MTPNPDSLWTLAASGPCSHNDMMKPERILILVVGGIVALAVIAAVVAALRPVAEFAEGTPEATVQEYIRAVLDGDGAAAATLFAGDSPCSADDIERDLPADPARVVLQSSETDGARATVRVEIVSSSDGGPFETYEYSQEERFRLVEEGGRWLITEEPWPMFFCREERR